MEPKSPPAWLRKHTETLASVLIAKQQQAHNSLIIEARGNQFWADLIAELNSVKDGLTPPILGQFHHSNFDVSKSEDHCQLKVSFIGDGTAYRSGYVDVWFRPETKKLWFTSTLLHEPATLTLCVSGGSVCAVTASHTEPMDAEAAAELIAKPLVDHALSAALAA